MDVGDRVVCVNDKKKEHAERRLPLTKGKIYTLTFVGDIGGAGICLVKEATPSDGYNWFGLSRFRKLITDHTESFESSELSRKLANKPQIKEELEKTKTKEYAEH